MQRLWNLLLANRSRMRHVAIYLGFSVATSGISLLSVMALTRLIPSTEYGLIGIFFSALTFIIPLISVSADGLIGVNITKLDEAGYLKFQQTYISLAYSCFAVLQLFMIVTWFMGGYQNLILMSLPFFALVRFLSTMAGTEYVAEQRSLTYGVLTLTTSAMSLLLTIVLIKLFGAWGSLRILAMFAADAMMLLVRYRGRAHLLFQFHLDGTIARQILRFGLPSLIAVAGAWAMNESDKLVVAKFAGMHEAGIYTAAAALAAIMLTFNQSVTNALYPSFFHSLGNALTGIRHLIIRYTAAFVGLSSIFCFLVLLAYWLFSSLLLPPRYLAGGGIFTGLMFAGIARSFYMPMGLLADYYQLARTRTVAIMSGGGVTLIISCTGVKYSSAIWAAIGIAGGYLTAGVILVLGLYRYRRNNESRQNAFG